MDTAQIIQEQIGNACAAMIGARDFVKDANSLTFKVGRNPKGVRWIRVVYVPGLDTYVVEGIKLNARGSQISKEEGVYCDTLRDSIARLTGLRVRL